MDKDGVTIFILDDRVIINFGVIFLLQLQIINYGRYPQARENGQLDVKIRQLSLRLQMLQINVVDDHRCKDDFPHIQREVITVELQFKGVLIQNEVGLLQLLMRDSTAFMFEVVF